MAEEAPPARLPAAQARVSTAAAVAALLLALAATMVWPPRPMLLWNASPSTPRGLYSVSGADPVRAGDMVVAWPPRGARQLAWRRRYLPATVPLVKHAAAVRGDLVCAVGSAIRVNGLLVARRSRADPSGRPMPWWKGCRRLHGGEFLLLSPGVRSAFDGRYFGPSHPSEIIGRARLLWRR